MSARNFRYLPHTADVAFVARGKNFRQSFENAALAILNLMFDLRKLEASTSKVKTIRITQKAQDVQELAWLGLQKMVSTIDERGVCALRLKVNRIERKKGALKLHACIFYKKPIQYLSLMDVKAVTPSGFSARKEKDGWKINAILDV